MSREWENDFSSIVKETESNLAKVRQRLDGSRYSTNRHYSSNSPLRTYPAASSTLSRSYIPSSSFARNEYSSLNDWRPRSAYQSQFTQGTSSEGESLPSSAAESPAMISMLTDKIDGQNKTIQSLSRHLDALDRERDRNQTHLRRLEQEVSSLSNRLQEGGVHLETERKIEGWKGEVTLQLNDLQGQVATLRKNGLGDNDNHSDDVLESLTREVHAFKRQVQEDLAVCRREIDSLNTRLMRHEVDIGNNQANNKDLSRRLDHIDRTVAGVSESQRSHSREINQTMHGRQTSNQELHQLRSEMSRLMSNVERLENEVLTNSHRINDDHPSSTLKTNGLYHNPSTAIKAPVCSPIRKGTGSSRRKTRKSEKLLKLPFDATRRRVSDSDDLSVSLSLASSDSDDFSLDLPPHHGRNVRKNILGTRPRDDESSDAFSELTSALIEHDPNLDLVDLASTPSISSLELDGDADLGQFS